MYNITMVKMRPYNNLGVLDKTLGNFRNRTTVLLTRLQDKRNRLKKSIGEAAIKMLSLKNVLLNS